LEPLLAARISRYRGWRRAQHAAAMALTLATVLQRFRLALAPDQGPVLPEPHIAIRPKGGLHMVPTHRSPR
jgi:hypothetical protein